MTVDLYTHTHDFLSNGQAVFYETPAEKPKWVECHVHVWNTDGTATIELPDGRTLASKVWGLRRRGCTEEYPV